MDRAGPAVTAPDDGDRRSGRAERDRGRRWWWCFAALGLAATVVRLAAIAHQQRGWSQGMGTSYDEAIYLGGSWALWSRGAVPYRDFVWVFPPGHLLLLAPVTLVTRLLGRGPGLSLTMARGLAAVAGGASTYLVGRIGARWIGLAGGLAAALLYATSSVAWPTEATALQEPIVNLLILLAAWWWLATTSAGTRRRVAVALLVGLAISVKLVAGIFLVPFLAIGAFPRPVRDRVVFVVLTAVPLTLTGLVAIVAAGLRAPFDQAVLAQLTRPRGAAMDRVDSLLPLLRGQIPGLRSLAGLDPRLAVVAAGALAVGAVVAGGRPGRFWGVTVAAVGGVLLASPSYFPHYGTLVAPGIALLTAWILTVVVGPLGRREHRLGAAVVVTLAAVLAGLQVAATVDALPGPDRPLPAAMAETLRTADCVFAVRPQTLFDLGRLPSEGPDGHVLFDVYGSALVGRLHERTDDRAFGAYRVPSVQRELIRSARSCRYTLLFDRRCPAGQRDLTAATERAMRRGTTLVAKQGCTLLLRRDPT